MGPMHQSTDRCSHVEVLSSRAFPRSLLCHAVVRIHSASISIESIPHEQRPGPPIDPRWNRTRWQVFNKSCCRFTFRDQQARSATT
jgi:hypothetical protein